MAEKSKRSSEIRVTPPVAPAPAGGRIAGADAPFIYLDGAPSAGHLNGIVQVTVDAIRLIPAPGEAKPLSERVIVGHLRMNVPAARQLIAALQAVVAMAERTGPAVGN